MTQPHNRSPSEAPIRQQWHTTIDACAQRVAALVTKGINTARDERAVAALLEIERDARQRLGACQMKAR